MIKLRKKLAAIIMTGMLMAGTAFAKGGMLISDLTGEQEQQCSTDEKGGVIFTLTGVIFTTFTGVIFTATGEAEAQCDDNQG